VPRFVLASASPARRALLESAGLRPEVMISGVDESTLTASMPAAGPGELATVLAAAKAHAVGAAIIIGAGAISGASAPGGTAVPGGTVPDGETALVLGCDSVLELDGAGYGKPADPTEAVRRWRRMAGRSGVLHTGHCLLAVRAGRVVAETAELASTTVHFGRPDPAELDAYVETGEPLAVAGAFTLDGRGGWFVDGIEGDHGNVLGLSLPVLRTMLRTVGVRVIDLWT